MTRTRLLTSPAGEGGGGGDDAEVPHVEFEAEPDLATVPEALQAGRHAVVPEAPVLEPGAVAAKKQRL